ncbi:MAG: cupin domain-containing protein [Thermoanaerobaculia bacterium]
MKKLTMLLTGLLTFGPALAAGGAAAPSLDPAVVNAKMEHVKLDNSRVRVIEGTLQPGDKEQMHEHPNPFVTYILSGGRIRNHFADGKVVEAELATGDALYREPQTHWAENIGTTPIHFIVVELKKAD